MIVCYLLQSNNFCFFKHFDSPKRARRLDKSNTFRKCKNSSIYISLTLCVENLTLPKDPVPKVTLTSKSVKEIGVGKVRTAADISYVIYCNYWNGNGVKLLNN